MTPKEKARDLVDKFVYHVASITDWGQLNNAKECALIAVEEMLKNDSWSSSLQEWNTFKNYCLEVKTEINKIEL